MPELPDVESFKRYLNKTSLHKKIKNADVKNSKILGKVSPKKLQGILKDNKLKSSKRHGKNLFIELNKKWLIMHFGMTGNLKYYKNMDEAPKHTRLLINFTNGYHLAYDSQRMLGKIDLINSVNEYIERKKIGPDPLEDNLSSKQFFKILENRKGTIKSALMNQKIIAGLGNIYSDEILFQTDLRPDSALKKLSEKDLNNIYKKMNSGLKKSIEKNAEPEDLPETYLLHNRKEGKDCPKCSGKIKKKTINGRSSYFCNKHQKKK